MSPVIIPASPPWVVRAHERREMERRAIRRERCGIPCPKCGTKNLHDDGWGVSWSGGANHVATSFMCRTCNSQYEEVAEFRSEWDRETWERKRVVARVYTRLVVGR